MNISIRQNIIQLLLFCILSSSCVHHMKNSYPQKIYHKVVVKRGDSLFKLSKLFVQPWQDIAKLNRLSTKHPLKIGQTLYVNGNSRSMRSKYALIRGPLFRVSRRQSISGYLYTSPAFLWPVKGRISSGYGVRGSRFHQGVDIAPRVGTPIRATASGRVKSSGWQGGYGKTIVISHPEGESLYGHCSSLSVSKGQWVEQGQVIGRVGNTGRSTGPHLHFEIKDIKRQSFDPIAIFKGTYGGRINVSHLKIGSPNAPRFL